MILAAYIAWLALATSLVMLALLAATGELDRPVAVVALVCLAAYWEFFARSNVVVWIGVGVQTLVAIYLILRWRWIAP
jgi:hypothetical membrane protein